MQSNNKNNGGVSKSVWTGRVITTICTLFLIFDGSMKVIRESHVEAAMTMLGFPNGLTTGLGLVILVCTLLYVLPPTSIFGAILITGWLGGAVAVMVRVDQPGHPFLFPIVFGILVWLGLYLRGEKLQRFIPIRREN